MFGLGHFDLTPVIYGLIIFVGLMAMWAKLLSGKLMALTIEVAVFIIVFKLHGGTMAGGFAATIAAVLAGAIFPRMIGR